MYGRSPINYAKGFKVIDGRTKHTGYFTALSFPVDTVINEIKSKNINGFTFTGNAFPVKAQTTIEGIFTEIQLTSGIGIAYKG